MGKRIQAASGALIAAVLLASGAAPADAARRPTTREAKAIKTAALRDCEAPPGSSCRWHGARVSTRDPRFVWARVTSEGLSAALMKRTGDRYRVLIWQGGGVERCARFRRFAPRAVLADLKVVGVDASGNLISCG